MPKETSARLKKEPEKSKSLESWIWDAACSIRGAIEAEARETDKALRKILKQLGI